MTFRGTRKIQKLRKNQEREAEAKETAESKLKKEDQGCPVLPVSVHATSQEKHLPSEAAGRTGHWAGLSNGTRGGES